MDAFGEAGKHFQCRQAQGSYVAPFFPGELVAHVATLEDEGEYFWAEGRWTSCSKKMYFPDGTVVNVQVPQDARLTRLKQWKFFIFPKKLSAEVEDFFQTKDNYYEVRQGMPILSWVVNLQGEPFPSKKQSGGTCCWVYYEQHPGKFDGQGDRSSMDVGISE